MNIEKLLEDIKMVKFNFIVIYIIHKTLVSLKITRTLKLLLRSIFFFKKALIFFTNYSDENL